MVATNAFGWVLTNRMCASSFILISPILRKRIFKRPDGQAETGKRSYAVILYAKSDKTTLHKRVADTFPDKEYILDVYEHLQYYYQMAMGDGFQCVREFNLEEFCRKFKYFPVPVDSALKILTQAGYLEYTDEQDNAFPHPFYDSPGRAVQTTGDGKRNRSADTDNPSFLHRGIHGLCLYQRGFTVDTHRADTRRDL